MNGYVTNIEQQALENTHFRTVLYTSTNAQLVLMSLLPNEDIGVMHATKADAQQDSEYFDGKTTE